MFQLSGFYYKHTAGVPFRVPSSGSTVIMGYYKGY